MASEKKEYSINFYTQRQNTQILNDELSNEDCHFKEKFTFIDIDSKKDLQTVKEYFLSFFGHKYKCCICQLILCKKDEENEKYTILNDTNLSSLNSSQLYLIKKREKCKCQLKDYIDYFSQSKYNLILEIITFKTCLQKSFQTYGNMSDENKKEFENLRKMNIDLKNLNSRISKLHEIDNLKDDDFYDVVIDIKSVKSIKEGWKIKMSEIMKNIKMRNY